MITVKVPNKVCSDFNGYSFFIDCIKILKNVVFEDIVFDFNINIWFEANLCAVLGAIMNSAQSRLNNVSIVNLNTSTQNILSRNNFLAAFGGEIIPDKNKTTIKYRRNKLTEEKLIKEFLFNELIKKQDFPKLSEIAQKEIVRSIFEIYSNAIIHGNSIDVYSCGQYYPGKEPPRIDFTIVDMGKTIKRNVNDFLKDDLSGKEAIKWAVKEQNTTKSKNDNIPGGLGFKLITDFMSLNLGKIQIISSDGFWEMRKGEISTNSFSSEFPGTLVNLEFNLDDSNFYHLKSEKVEDIVF
ncbi:MAG: ATP-binding protein [Bacteroidota bacterium]